MCGKPARDRFCSNECSALAQRNRGAGPRKGRTCAQCGATFDAGNANQRTCSVECWRALSAATAQPKPKSSRVYFPACRGCGRMFAARVWNQCWCSNRCWLDGQGEKVSAFYRLACAVGAGGAQWRARLVGYLVDRDGNRCGICRRAVDLTLRSGARGSDLGPSIDHVVPRSQGGSDDLANLRLAHWGCNRRRRDRGGNEQLALVG